MNVILFGASGMIGQGVLRECLLDPTVTKVLAIGRSAMSQAHPKLEVITTKNLMDLSPFSAQLTGYDACFFTLGASSVGMTEADYTNITYDLTVSVAQLLQKLNSGMTFIYVSGRGTDSTEKGSKMWARVKGRTENAILHMGFKGAYMFRFGAVVPLHGIRSKTPLYNSIYVFLGPLVKLLRALFPRFVLTTEQIGKAMVRVATSGAPKPILESADIYEIAQSA